MRRDVHKTAYNKHPPPINILNVKKNYKKKCLAASCFCFIFTCMYYFLPDVFTMQVDIESSYNTSHATLWLTAYVPEYRISHVEAHLDSVSTWVDELILFSIQPASDGSLIYDPGLHLSQLSLAKKAKQKGLKSSLICVGGGGRSQGFEKMIVKKKSRNNFINNLIDLCLMHDFNGVDMNYEGPESPKLLKEFKQLILEMNASFHEHALLITLAMHYWSDIGLQVYKLVDRLHVMTYDIQTDKQGGQVIIINVDGKFFLIQSMIYMCICYQFSRSLV